jgi:hypothetical protein
VSETHRAASGTFYAAALSKGRVREHPAASKGPDFLAVFASPGRPTGTQPGCSPAQNPIRTSLHRLVYLCLADLCLARSVTTLKNFGVYPLRANHKYPFRSVSGMHYLFAEKSPGSSCSSIRFCCFALNVESNYSNCWFAFGIRLLLSCILQLYTRIERSK